MDVEQLTSALSREISDLRTELLVVRSERENELRSNLLTYIQALPERDLIRLTADMSDDVVLAIQMLVDALMDRLGIAYTSGGILGSGGDGNSVENGSEIPPQQPQPEMIIQQSVGQLAQLCMWQMVVGYKLREIEALDKGVSLD